MDDWSSLNKHPSVLTSFINKLGVQGCEIEEVYNLENLEDSKHVFGIVLLYSWSPNPIKESLFEDPDLCIMSTLDPKLSIQQGILTVLLNSEANIGPELLKFRSLALPLPPKLRSVAMHNSAFIRTCNNSCISSEKDLQFFTCFFPKKGKVVEVDGLAGGPNYFGEGSEDDWLERTKHALQEKLTIFSEYEVKFSILAVMNNKIEVSENTLKTVEKQIAAIKKKTGGKVPDYDLEYFEGLPDDRQVLSSELANKEELKAHHESTIKAEKGKNVNWAEENLRRKHDFTPFILSVLQKLHEKHQLTSLLEQAMKKKLNLS